MKILVVDDEEIVHKSCRRILQDEQYDMVSVYSAEEGIEQLNSSSYDLVVSDLVMHGMDGMELLQFVRENKSDIPVIIFTGYATAETARKALKMGAFDYIPKPFSPDEFREVVDNALESRKGSANDSQMLDIMAIVSHELKSPVSVVHTTAETLYEGYLGNLDPQQQEIVAKIIRNCNYLEDIIRSYIDLAKVELDNIETFTQEIDLVSKVILPVVEIPEHMNNYRNMRLVNNLPDELVVAADPNLLKIVVTNLVNNAIKYGKDNTDIIISLLSEGKNVKLSVYNEGVGISAADIKDNLFNKFARLKQKGTEGIKGTGLGLYMCKKIVEKHKGTLSVESQEGSWVKFTVNLQKGAG